jgi:endonuclease-3
VPFDWSIRLFCVIVFVRYNGFVKNFSKENFEQKSMRASEIAKRLIRMYKRRKTVLNFGSPWECLVAVQLSAQCTDKRVNLVTPALFKKYKMVDDYAKAPISELEKMIRSTGFYKNKARNIKAAAEKIVKNFEGKLPANMDDLLTLPGIARKSANVILFNAFGVVSGVAVDTHVMRIVRLLGLISKKVEGKPEKIEAELMELLPLKHWALFSLLITEHGREICIANRPKCGECRLRDLCRYGMQFASRQTEVRRV